MKKTKDIKDNMKKTKDMNGVELQRQSKRSKQLSESKIRNITKGSALQCFTSQLHGIHQKKNHKYKSKQSVKGIHQWDNLSPDLLRLVIDKLNYEERIRFRVVCKGWNFIKASTSDFVHKIPLNVVVAILMRLSITRFQDFFNFYIYWIKGQTETTIKALLDQIPIQQLYKWGNKVYKSQHSMFTYFMNMSQRLRNNDAEFYWASKSIILRHHNINFDILECSYTIIKHISETGHPISILFKNMLDIYFFPEKRKDAVTALINLITKHRAKKTITGMIMALRSISDEIYPESIFGPLSTPICSYTHERQYKQYQADGYPVHPEQIDEYTCMECKVALLFGCLSANDFYHM